MHGEMSNTYTVKLSCIHLSGRDLGVSETVSIKMDHKDVRFEGANWIELA
jgi:hypothetical protein